MSSLVNIVLAVVLNLFSFGTVYQNDTIASTLAQTRIIKKQNYKLEDLKTHYLITKEELSQNLVGTN